MTRPSCLGLFLLLPAGCAADPGEPTYACFEVPVEPAAVDRPRPATDLPADRLAEIRRSWVRDPGGWAVVVDDPDRFMLLRADPGVPGRYEQAQFDREEGRWYASGAACDLQRQVPGHVATELFVAAGKAPAATTRSVTVQAKAQECRSGARTEPTVLSVEEGTNAVRILVKARALPPEERGETRTCLPNLPTTVRVPLESPLGGRSLIDVGVYPPPSSAELHHWPSDFR